MCEGAISGVVLNQFMQYQSQPQMRSRQTRWVSKNTFDPGNSISGLAGRHTIFRCCYHIPGPPPTPFGWEARRVGGR